MKPYLTLLGGALMLAACSNTSAIEEAVKEKLIDPESARFGDIFEYNEDGVQKACAMVNSKNRMGGYTGEEMVLLTRNEEGDWQAGYGVPRFACVYHVESKTTDFIRH